MTGGLPGRRARRGVGGSRFALGVRAALARRADAAAPASVDRFTVVVNTGDDLWLSGVRLQPDVDSIVYALAGVNDAERGWGRAGDSERVNHELQEWGAGLAVVHARRPRPRHAPRAHRLAARRPHAHRR